MGKHIQVIKYLEILESPEQLIGLKVFNTFYSEETFIKEVKDFPLIWVGRTLNDSPDFCYYTNIAFLTIDSTKQKT